jgi:hypothetical protein
MYYIGYTALELVVYIDSPEESATACMYLIWIHAPALNPHMYTTL